MPFEHVGYENLPNVFIKEVELTRKSQSYFHLTATLIIKDFMQNDTKYYWATDEILNKFLRIGFIAVRDKRMIRLLTEGRVSPLDSRLRDALQTKSIMFGQWSDIGRSREYVCEFASDHLENISNLSVFAFCFVDLKDLSREYQLTLKNHDHYHGPIRSENIYVNTELVRTTKIFTRENGVLWPGPVHSHAGDYMIGSYHTTAPHEKLSIRGITNFKIKDKRDILESKMPIVDYKSSIISKLWVSYDLATNINGIFVVNPKTMLISRSKYGAFLQDISTNAMKRILDIFKIKSFIIQRKRVTTEFRSNSIGTKQEKEKSVFFTEKIIQTKDDDNGVLKKSIGVKKDKVFHTVIQESETQLISGTKKTSAVKELDLDYGDNLRYFQFTDFELTSKTPGKYKYTVDLYFTDPVFLFLQNSVSEMKKNISIAKKYLTYISRRRNYDFNLNKTKFTTYELDSLNDLANSYGLFYSYLYDTDNKKISEIIQKYYSMINPVSATVSSVRKFVEEVRNLYAEYVRFFELREQSSYSGEQSQISFTFSAEKNKIRFSEMFENVIVPSSNHSNFNYLGHEKSIGTRILSKKDLEERMRAEVDKHLIGDIPGVDVSFTKFFSPSLLSSGEDSMNLTTTGINQDDYNSLLGVESTSDHSVGPPDDTSDSLNRYINVKKIIGENNHFVSNLSDDEYYELQQNEAEQSTELIASAIDTPEILREMTDHLSGDVPMQILAAHSYNNENVNSAIALDGKNPSLSVKARNFLEFNNFNVQRLKFLDRFTKDRRNEPDLNNPIFLDLNLEDFKGLNRSVICRFESYSNNLLKIEGRISIGVTDSVFIMSDKSVEKLQRRNAFSPFTSNFLGANAITYEQTRSNIIKQKNNNKYLDRVETLRRTTSAANTGLSLSGPTNNQDNY
jgi:hypothetical protein